MEEGLKGPPELTKDRPSSSHSLGFLINRHGDSELVAHIFPNTGLHFPQYWIPAHPLPTIFPSEPFNLPAGTVRPSCSDHLRQD